MQFSVFKMTGIGSGVKCWDCQLTVDCTVFIVVMSYIPPE
jgi:hypothetical protein